MPDLAEADHARGRQLRELSLRTHFLLRARCAGGEPVFSDPSFS
jgi:hypothetical protein